MSENKITTTRKDLTLAHDIKLNEKQLNILLKKTPKAYVKERPAKGGGKWKYVSGGYVRKVLNLMFGWDWDFEIMDETLFLDSGQVVVKGRLTCRSKGATIVKMQYGRHEIQLLKSDKKPLDLGNDFKAAATDALKKCAAEIGIAADIYNADEFKEIQVDLSDLDQIKELLVENAHRLALADLERVKEIIDEKEEASYSKVLQQLKNLNDEQ